MPISLDQALGPHAQALNLRAERGQVLASNIANADTPNYKARDLDFSTALASAQDNGLGLRVTDARHLTGSQGGGSGELLYRVPEQPALDGNTVDSRREQAAFAENALHYQASLKFLSGRITGIKNAIKGE